MSKSKAIHDGVLHLSCRRFKTEIATLDSFVSAQELTERALLQIGDIVEIDRIIYSHWALYVGNGEVAHVTGPRSDIATTTNARVARCSLLDVVGDSLVRVNNKTVRAKERGVSVLPVDVTVKNALSLVGSTVTYNFLTRNSEHYVTEWRYDSSWSDEAETASHAMTVFSSSPVQEYPEEAHRTMQVGITNILHSPTNCHSSTSPSYLASSPSNQQPEQNWGVVSPPGCKVATKGQHVESFQNSVFVEPTDESSALDECIREPRDLSPRDDTAIRRKPNHHIDVQAAQNRL
ncbi:uncharacterized protein LOC121377094 [Gigantopelta aegis]|uniref:uncharacterized protein LOC121377094 n=1 Tax=Gigantopelta aegis TaxID=1735272 RepID=UPI001B887E02|nr:uncharacterized protein LOC121377094 [Gigantopelta aegis]